MGSSAGSSIKLYIPIHLPSGSATKSLESSCSTADQYYLKTSLDGDLDIIHT